MIVLKLRISQGRKNLLLSVVDCDDSCVLGSIEQYLYLFYITIPLFVLYKHFYTIIQTKQNKPCVW